MPSAADYGKLYAHGRVMLVPCRRDIAHVGLASEGEGIVKYTFLSKWTVLILTVITALLFVGGIGFIRGGLGSISLSQSGFLGFILLLVGGLVYAVAWIIGLADSIQERRWGWTVVMIILLPFWIGPLLYSLIGPRNTK